MIIKYKDGSYKDNLYPLTIYKVYDQYFQFEIDGKLVRKSRNYARSLISHPLYNETVKFIMNNKVIYSLSYEERKYISKQYTIRHWWYRGFPAKQMPISPFVGTINLLKTRSLIPTKAMLLNYDQRGIKISDIIETYSEFGLVHAKDYYLFSYWEYPNSTFIALFKDDDIHFKLKLFVDPESTTSSMDIDPFILRIFNATFQARTK